RSEQQGHHRRTAPLFAGPGAEPRRPAASRRRTRGAQEAVRLGRAQGERHERGRARRDLSVPAGQRPAMLEMRGIAKSYGAVRANRGIDLTVGAGKIVGLLGENGSGKSTLMKVLFGMVRPDAGTIAFKGQPLARHSPGDAIAAGIGMIHQHFMLVDAMNVTENIMLGWERARRRLRPRAIAARVPPASK